MSFESRRLRILKRLLGVEIVLQPVLVRVECFPGPDRGDGPRLVHALAVACPSRQSRPATARAGAVGDRARVGLRGRRRVGARPRHRASCSCCVTRSRSRSSNWPGTWSSLKEDRRSSRLSPRNREPVIEQLLKHPKKNRTLGAIEKFVKKEHARFVRIGYGIEVWRRATRDLVSRVLPRLGGSAILVQIEGLVADAAVGRRVAALLSGTPSPRPTRRHRPRTTISRRRSSGSRPAGARSRAFRAATRRRRCRRSSGRASRGSAIAAGKSTALARNCQSDETGYDAVTRHALRTAYMNAARQFFECEAQSFGYSFANFDTIGGGVPRSTVNGTVLIDVAATVRGFAKAAASALVAPTDPVAASAMVRSGSPGEAAVWGGAARGAEPRRRRRRAARRSSAPTSSSSRTRCGTSRRTSAACSSA